MANNECVWFKNQLTGAVDGVEKGSAAHKRMASEVVEISEGDFVQVWERIKAPKVTSQKYGSGLVAKVFKPGKAQDEEPADSDGGSPEGPKGPADPPAGGGQ